MRFAAQSSDLTVRAAWLEFLITRTRFDLAAEYWKSTSAFLRAEPQAALSALEPVLQGLLHAQKFAEAYAVWQDLRAMQIIREDRLLAGELLFNADFGQTVLDCGFDWQIREQPFVSVHFSASEEQRAGVREDDFVQIEFAAGHNAEYEPLFQFVRPGAEREFELTALIRAERLQSGSGPRIRITDAQCRQRLDLSTDEILGTTGWHEQRLRFSVPLTTRFLRISLWRPRSRVFPMDISGSLWLKRISLRAVAPATELLSGVVSARAQDAVCGNRCN